MKDPSILSRVPAPIYIEDFDRNDTISRVSFFAISNLIAGGAGIINIQAVESYLNSYPEKLAMFRINNGRSFLEASLEKGEPLNFELYYNKLKKDSLLRDLDEHGYDVSPFNISNLLPGENTQKIIDRYENSDEEDVISYVEGQLSAIKTKHQGTSRRTCSKAGDEIFELIESYQEAPDIGPELCGELFNSIVGGAHLGQMMLRSAPTNAGKTRTAAYDACNLVYPIRWEDETNSFVLIKDREPQKVLFITTEMTAPEIKQMILAYVSGLETKVIARGQYTEKQLDRLRTAARIIKHFSDYFIFEEINDPNLTNIANVIKQHVMLDKVQYVFYDYIFTSPSLMSTASNMGVREDVILMMLANQLKELAKQYGFFISTSTQLNGEGLKVGEKRDQRVLRGSKAIADKTDLGIIFSQVDQTELEKLEPYIKRYGTPTHVTDLYKLRNGAHKGCRIWSQVNLGNGVRRDLFITDQQFNPIVLDGYEIIPRLRGAPIERVDDTLLNDFFPNEEEEEEEECAMALAEMPTLASEQQTTAGALIYEGF